MNFTDALRRRFSSLWFAITCDLAAFSHGHKTHDQNMAILLTCFRDVGTLRTSTDCPASQHEGKSALLSRINIKPGMRQRTATLNAFRAFCVKGVKMQKTLPFGTSQDQQVLVRLSDSDRAYRLRCIEQERAFPDHILLEARCQRRGISKGEFCHLPRFEQTRELADEECILRYDDWETARPSFIDWQKCNASGKAVASEFQKALCTLVESRMQ